MAENAQKSKSTASAGNVKGFRQKFDQAAMIYENLKIKNKNVEVQKLLDLLIKLINLVKLIDNYGGLLSNLQAVGNYYYHIKSHLLNEIKAEFSAQKPKA